MVIRLLHQRQWNGRRLRVEFAKPEQIRRLPSHHICDLTLKSKIKRDQFQTFRDQIRELQPQFITDSILMNSNFEDIPKANEQIVTQIRRFLLENEKFYKCVVALMIKLGLELSFTWQHDQSLSDIPMPNDSEDEESELETDLTVNDLNQSQAPKFELERRRRRRKRLKTGFIGDNAESFHMNHKASTDSNKITTEIEEIFDTVPKPKKPSINLATNLSSISSSSDSVIILTGEGFGSLVKPPSTTASKSKNDNNFDLCLLRPKDLISDEELESNVLPREKWPEYSVFKNYSIGEQKSHRLYVKNIHRKVTTRDLYRLFARYIDLDNDDHVDKFGIIYMEKGRMRGQAFVTYPEMAQASLALESTNGFIFYDRPIVVQYGRSSNCFDD
ncbi:RNA-binding protein 40-like protein [Euroglyphus maynei]|uniref:RNA-binding protein 40-like protein n=1 Tax=Euroglyphus maynei TaxID=6958 RepID=A0A1Y3B779_EURMA|nr:RNA-binding protein 40-like protein [Euroglyphus maynei]